MAQPTSSPSRAFSAMNLGCAHSSALRSQRMQTFGCHFDSQGLLLRPKSFIRNVYENWRGGSYG
jgi:hypothetical protein